jgi:peptide/nickel transport system substrate-binding protein
MKRKKLTSILALILALSMILSACSQPTAAPTEQGPATVEPGADPPQQSVSQPTAAPMSPSPEPAMEKAEQVLIAALAGGPGAGEPEAGKPWTGNAGHTLHTKLYLPPTILNEDLTEIIPFAVESWESNVDFTVWTYKLRENLVWSDGAPLTAKDWKFTAEFITSPEYVVPNLAHRSLAFGDVVGFDEKVNGEAEELVGIRVIDDLTIEYTIKAPNPRHFATQYRTYILPEHAVDFTPGQFLETGWWLDPTRQVGAGPFVIGQFEKDSYLMLERNPLYFEGEPKLERIIIPLYGGDLTAPLLKLMAGEIHFSYVEPTDLPVLGDGYNIFYNNSNVAVFLDIHYPEVPEFWQDIKVRQAILHAIDRQVIVDEVLDGTHFVLHCPVSFPELWPPGLNMYEYNPQRALELLAEANISPSDIKMEWVSHSGYDNIHHNSALQAAQAFLADIGIDMTFRFVDVPTFRERYTKDGPWTFHYRGGDIPLYPPSFARNWSQGGAQGGDFKGFDMIGSGLQAALDVINSAPTTEAYFEAIGEFCALHNETLPDIQLWMGNRYGAASKEVANFWWMPAGGGGPYYDNAHNWVMVDR